MHERATGVLERLTPAIQQVQTDVTLTGAGKETKFREAAAAALNELEAVATETRAAREANDVTIVVLPGKQHLSAIVAGSMPKEYLNSLVGFINTHDTI